MTRMTATNVFRNNASYILKILKPSANKVESEANRKVTGFWSLAPREEGKLIRKDE